jgi:hypothetical protein
MKQMNRTSWIGKRERERRGYSKKIKKEKEEDTQKLRVGLNPNI